MTTIEMPTPHASAPQIAEVVQAMWTRAGEDAEVLRDVFVLLPRTRRVEWVCDSVDTISKSGEMIRKLLESDVKVNVLVPVSMLGTVHEELRGLAVSLQGWIEDAEGLPRFVSPERA